MPTRKGKVKFKYGTLAQYNQLVSNNGIDQNTWYIITDHPNESIYVGTTLVAQNLDVNLRPGTAASSVILKWNNSAIANTASQSGAVALGRSSTASKTSAFAAGQGTIADVNYMTALGRFNKGGDSKSLFVVGAGEGSDSGATTRKDGLKVNSDGSANPSGMGGSVAANKFSCNTLSVTTPAMLTVSFQLTQPVALTWGSTNLISPNNPDSWIKSFTLSANRLSNASAIRRTDSTASPLTIYVDGVQYATLADGDSFVLSNLTSASLVEFVN